MICINPPLQSQQDMTQAALSIHEMYHQLFLLSFPIWEYYILLWASILIYKCFINLKCFTDYSNSTFYNPIKVLPSLVVECWYNYHTGDTKARHYLLDYLDATCDLAPFGIRHLLWDDNLGMQNPIYCQKEYQEMVEKHVRNRPSLKLVSRQLLDIFS